MAIQIERGHRNGVEADRLSHSSNGLVDSEFPNTLYPADPSEDPVRQYLNEIEQYPLPNPEAVEKLFKTMERGQAATLLYTLHDVEAMMVDRHPLRNHLSEQTAQEYLYELGLAESVMPIVTITERKRKGKTKIIRNVTSFDGAFAPDESQQGRLQMDIEAGKDARKKLIESNLRLPVSRTSRLYGSRGKLNFLDLVQSGNIGLMRGIELFELRQGNKLSTYVTRWIDQGIQRAVDDESRTVRLPVYIQDII